MHLPLNNNLSFAITHGNNKVRLIVYNGNNEFVCRKETFSALKKFTRHPRAHIFKGRLQLLKEDDVIIVQVKGIHAGQISAEDFSRALTTFKKISLLVKTG